MDSFLMVGFRRRRKKKKTKEMDPDLCHKNAKNHFREKKKSTKQTVLSVYPFLHSTENMVFWDLSYSRDLLYYGKHTRDLCKHL